MKKTNYYLFVALTIGLGLISACNKQNDATITIEEPVINDTIFNLDTLHMEGTIIGGSKLDGYTLTLTNLSTNELIYTGSTSNKKKEYAFHEHQEVSVLDTSILEVKVTVNLNRSGKMANKSVTCVVIP